MGRGGATARALDERQTVCETRSIDSPPPPKPGFAAFYRFTGRSAFFGFPCGRLSSHCMAIPLPFMLRTDHFTRTDGVMNPNDDTRLGLFGEAGKDITC